MSLPTAVTSHHTAWVSSPGRQPHPVRYAVDGDKLVCFGDAGLEGVPDHTHVSVSIHEIAGGQVVAQFGAALHLLTPDEVSTNALVELLDHVVLGRTLAEVQIHLDDQRANRRILELIP